MKIEKFTFKDREDAYLQLCDNLPLENMLEENWHVLATSLGGVPIAKKIAKKLDSSFDYIFTHKIFASNNSECEIAIVTETSEVVIHEELMKSFALNLKSIYKKADEIYESNIIDYKQKYRDGKDLVELVDANVLLVDEGLNTGLTMMACIKSIIAKGAKSICVAVPVLPTVTVNDIEAIADDLYYVKSIDHFVSIDFYYDDLETIKFEDIK